MVVGVAKFESMTTGHALKPMQLIDLSSSVDAAHWELWGIDSELMEEFGVSPSQGSQTPTWDEGQGRMPQSFVALQRAPHLRDLAKALCGSRVEPTASSELNLQGRHESLSDGTPRTELMYRGKVLDLRGLCKSGEAISIDSLQIALDAVSNEIYPNDAVLLRTGQEAYTPSDVEYFNHPWMSREGTLYLMARGARVLGIDTPSWHCPHTSTARLTSEIDDLSGSFATDAALDVMDAFIVTQISNLEFLPLSNFKVSVCVMPNIGATVRSCRVVAYLEDSPAGTNKL